jgi:transcription elongation factor Elf1
MKKNPKYLIGKFKCKKCDHKWKVKKKLKQRGLEWVNQSCPECDSRYFEQTNFEELFGDMDLHEIVAFTEKYSIGSDNE